MPFRKDEAIVIGMIRSLNIEPEDAVEEESDHQVDR